MEQITNFPGLVPKNEIQSYLDKNGIIVKRLPNNLTIIGSNRPIPDENSASVEIIFPSGAYFDPKDKQGILHVLEHLIAHEPSRASKISEGYLNAHTNIHELRIIAKGIANPKVRDYGFWPIMPSIFKALINPTTPTVERLEVEKKVVLREHAERTGNGQSESVRNSMLKLLFGHNPLTNSVDTTEGVKSVTVDDIKKLQERILIAAGVFVEVFTQGSPNLLNSVFSELEQNLGYFAKGDQEPLVFDHELFKITNPDFELGRLYPYDDSSESGNINIEFVWKYPTSSFDSRTFALAQLWQELGRRFFSHVRESGYGYSAGSDTLSTLEKSRYGTRFSILGMRTHTMDNIEGYSKKILDEIRNRVINPLTDDELDRLLYRISRPIEARPLSVTQKLKDTLKGLQFYGSPINSQTIQDTLLSITRVDLKYWKEQLLDDNPAFIVTGDLGKHPTKKF